MRQLATATSQALDNVIIPLAAIVYLDILNDPLFGWTGIGDLSFAPGETGDNGLDGKTFSGAAGVFEISGIGEGAGGSDALEISFPGIKIDDVMLRQVVRDRSRWQFRRAVVWLVLLDPDTSEIVGKPFRIKTGRMDAMPYDENGGKAEIKCVIEGQQSYGSEPLNSRYSEQINVDPNDTSQKYVYGLANMAATFGQPSAGATLSSLAPGGYGGSHIEGGNTLGRVIKKLFQ